MLYRKDKYGTPLSALGFGCMRFTRKGGGIRINLFNVKLVSDFLCAGSVAIADRDKLHTGNAVGDIACMLITKTSDSDHTHLKLFHVSFLLSKSFPESFPGSFPEFFHEPFHES